MAKYLKTAQAVAEVLGISKSRVCQLHRQGLPRRSDHTYDIEKVVAWNDLRLDKTRKHQRLTPKEMADREKELTKKALKARAIVVADNRALAIKFKNNRAEILVNGQAVRQDVADRILATMTDEQISGMTTAEKVNTLRAMDSGTATLHDRERLERGESTGNISVIVSEIKRLKEKRGADGGVRVQG